MPAGTPPSYPTRDAFEWDYPNVTGTAYAPDDTLLVFVTTKVPESELAPSEIVPERVTIDGRTAATDLIPVSIPHLMGSGGPDTPRYRPPTGQTPGDHQARHRPVPGGVSFGNEAIGAGTIGSPLLTHDGTPVVLTNAHTAAGVEGPHYQPAANDGTRDPEAAQIATLKETSELAQPDDGSPLTTDSALLSVDPQEITDTILGLGRLIAFDSAAPHADQTFTKAGRTTGVTEGAFMAEDAEMSVAYGPETLRFGGIDVFDDMSAPGDSGSLIGYLTDDGFVATSLLFAGSDTITLGIPIHAVMDYHGELTIPDSGDDDADSDPADTDFGQFRYQAQVGEITDGDTLDVTLDLGFSLSMAEQTLRLRGVDTAEIHGGVVRGSDEHTRGMKHLAFVEAWVATGRDEHDGDWPFVVATYKDTRGSFGRWIADVIRKSDGQSLVPSLVAEFGEDIRYESQLERLVQ